MKKDLSIAVNLTEGLGASISRVVMPFRGHPGRIEITFNYPEHLKRVQHEAEQGFLLKVLEAQATGKTKLKGLELRWRE